MPLFKTYKPNAFTTIVVWKITESFNDLFRQVVLKDLSLTRVENMSSEIHQKGFLAVRMLLQVLGYTDFDLFYDDFGKPNLNDGQQISISHSYEFSTIIVSQYNVGIDLELRRAKVATIAMKFAGESFLYVPMPIEEHLSLLTVVWGVKEAVFKIRNEKGISFRDHISVVPFQMSDKCSQAIFRFESFEKHYDFFFEELENYTLVWAWETPL
jgi:4'-phosphopantetheinyl transferase